MNKTLSKILFFGAITTVLLSGCYTKLAEPVRREYYYPETDTISTATYPAESAELSDYNQGYRDGYRDFLNEYLWHGYNPHSMFYSYYDPFWQSPWNYQHSFYLGIYDPFFYDPFWDWGYYGYYSPYSYYSYGGWYSPYYRHSYGYYHYYPNYYRSGHSWFARRYTDSEGRDQLRAKREPSSGVSAGASQAVRTPISSDTGFQNSLDLPMTARPGGSSTAASSNPLPDKPFNSDQRQDFTPKLPDIKSFDNRSTTIPDKPIPGFQTKLLPPQKPTPIPTKAKPVYTTPSQKRSTANPDLGTPARQSSQSETKPIRTKTKDRSSSRKSSSPRYTPPSESRSSSSSGSSSSSSSRSTSVRQSSGSSSSSSRSSSSRSSSSSSRSSSSSSSKSSSDSSPKKSRK